MPSFPDLPAYSQVSRNPSGKRVCLKVGERLKRSLVILFYFMILYANSIGKCDSLHSLLEYRKSRSPHVAYEKSNPKSTPKYKPTYIHYITCLDYIKSYESDLRPIDLIMVNSLFCFGRSQVGPTSNPMLLGDMFGYSPIVWFLFKSMFLAVLILCLI